MNTTPTTRGTGPTGSLLRRAGALAALGAASLALIAAVPASATDDKPPTDKNGKKSCALTSESGGTVWVPHGTTVTVHFKSGTQKEQCRDGDWWILRTSSGGRTVGGTSGTLEGSVRGPKVLSVAPSVLRRLPITPR
jgi:hypothetical protein